ncbi:MAG TPA: hypothetical protein VNO55_28200 [Polyangia bacterium]|nr:hypothetical protein [Polyangia bacterium]
MRTIGYWSWLVLILTAAGCTSFHGSHPDGGGDGALDKAVGDRSVAASDADASDQPTSCAAMTDPKNCGVCGHDCSTLPNVSPAAAVECRSGTCWVPPDGCSSGFAHCTATPNDGCETSISRPETCGACGTSCKTDAPFCASSGKTQTCVATCTAPSPDKCGAKCVDTQSDVANCGACGSVCSFPNANATCVKGVCTMSKCRDGYGDCTGAPGCETPLTTASNCGACGKSCAVAHGSAQCTTGTCGPVTCDQGFGNCDTANPDCETALTTDAHCGGCATTCSGASPLCATVAGQQTCVSDCAATAPTKCGNKCVDTKTDKNNCGTCGMVCSFPNADASCVNGQCVMGACKAGFGDCTNQAGCETPLDTSTNCGRCGNACTFANATSSCDGTRCTTPVCVSGYGNCETSSPDCETILNMPGHCGDCGTSCSGATPLCSSSSGRPTCVTDCTPSAPTKCGTACVNTAMDGQNCGMCGKVCTAPANGSPVCRNSVCDFDCLSGHKCGNACIPNDQPCNGACLSGLKLCGSTCVSNDTCCTSGQVGCGACESCQAGACKTTCASGRICSGNQCCDARVGQSCPSGECQIGTYDCNGDCVLKNKTDGVRCGTSDCPAKICQNGVCDFGGINSCPAGQVCSNNGGCILSGRRSKATLSTGDPYSARCMPCGGQFQVCCPGRICNDQATPFCVKTAGEYCSSDPTNGDNSLCEQYYYQ